MRPLLVYAWSLVNKSALFTTFQWQSNWVDTSQVEEHHPRWVAWPWLIIGEQGSVYGSGCLWLSGLWQPTRYSCHHANDVPALELVQCRHDSNASQGLQMPWKSGWLTMPHARNWQMSFLSTSLHVGHTSSLMRVRCSNVCESPLRLRK